ncbi:MAG: translocation/assembly module TamB domain-containing protein, partial [Flavobacteriaceae bacterium]
QNLAISSEDFDFKGAMDLNLNIKRSPSDNSLKFNGFVDDFVMNDLDMGRLRFFTSGNTQLNSYEVNLLLSDQGKSTMSAKGNILGFDQSPRLDLDFNFDDFDLSFLTPVGAGDVDDIRGKVSGGVNLWGPIDAPKHNGQLILNGGGLGVPDINTDYRFSNGTKVTLVDQSFNFNKTTLTDTRFGTQAELVGQINHLNFSDWGFDLNVDSERILMLNVPEEEDEVFFGDGFLRGKVHLYGPSKNLTIDVVGATEEGTSIKIPWADDYGLADTSFMKFVDKKKINKTQQKDIDESYSFTGLEMNFELDVNNNAEIKVVIDKESGSFLSGHGAGNILMEIDTNGKFNMWGDFITYDGIYNFKNLSVIDKKFNVKQGGTIVWEGDPLGAQMDLEAVYEVPGGANPAILLDNPNFNRKIPTEVLIRLQGNLLKPDDPIFEIDFPNTSAVVTSEINYRLADPQISQLQAISLLSQGIFINEVSVSVQGITNNLYEKASDLLSNLMGDDKGKLQVGLNYLQGDKSQVLDINSEDRLGLTLSTQITDKILLNGKIGVPVGGIEETLIVGDLQIDFILNEEGSLKAKVFNKENEFRYIGDELGYTQGIGLSYQVDFESFRELITKIIKGSQLNPENQNKLLVSEPSNAGINFINKN